MVDSWRLWSNLVCPPCALCVCDGGGDGRRGCKACTPNSPIMGAGTVEPTEFLTGPFGWLSENMHPLPENAVPGS